ncbi:hypothetical protein DITRI_Ditri01bG0087100 [Diplodiscus trichospermus]
MRKALWEVFNLYGKIMDVFISFNGKRKESKTTFAFVRCKHENEMWKAIGMTNNRKINGWHVQDQCSYKEVLVGLNSNYLEEPFKELRSDHILNERTNREGQEVDTEITYNYKIPDSEIEWLQGCAIGRLRDGMNIKNVQDILEAAPASCSRDALKTYGHGVYQDVKEKLQYGFR